jgi:O-antigen ligase
MATMSIGVAVFCALFVGLVFAHTEFRKECVQEFGGTGISAVWMKRYLQVTGVWISVILLSLVGASFFPLEFAQRTVPVRWGSDLAKVWYLVLPVLLVLTWSVLGRTRIQRILMRWWGFAVLLACIGIQQYWTGWPRPQLIPSSLEGRFHATLFLGHHLSVASIFIFPFFFGLAEWKSRRNRGETSAMILLGTLALALLLFLTYYRTLWVALPLGVAFYFFLGWTTRVRWVGAMVLVLLLGGLSQWGPINDRLRMQGGVTERTELWKAHWNLFLERPVLGVGWGKSVEISRNYDLEKFPEKSTYFVGHAHSMPLEALTSTGLVGGLVWLAWCWMWLSTVRNSGATEASKSAVLPYAFAGICVWIVFQLNGLTQVNFWESKVLHQVLIALSFAVVGWGIDQEKCRLK